MVTKGNTAMPTNLPRSRSELHSRPKQLRVADEPDAHDPRSEEAARALRIEIAIAIEILANGFDVRLAGNIALRISRQ